LEFGITVSFWNSPFIHLFMSIFAKNITYLDYRRKRVDPPIIIPLPAFGYLKTAEVQPNVQDLIILSTLFNVSIDDLLTKDLEARANLARSKVIKFLVLDVDGTLTDGGLESAFDRKTC